MTLEHRLISALVLTCAALLGIAIASAEILSQLNWAAVDNCRATEPVPAATTDGELPSPFRA